MHGRSSLALLPRQQNGSVDFVARATPSGGLDEPVRGFPFYLLSKSFEEISKEAEATYPKPDMDAFIDKLEVSNELKAWMKKNHMVQLSGEDFIHKLKARRRDGRAGILRGLPGPQFRRPDREFPESQIQARGQS